MWFTYAILSAVFAALVAIFAKLGLKNVDSTLATTIRSFIMAVFLIGVSFVFKKFQGFSLSDLSSRDWTLIILSGIAGALSWIFYFAALKYGFASRVAAIDRTSLIFVVIFAAMFLGEGLNGKVIAGGVLMVIGAIFITS